MQDDVIDGDLKQIPICDKSLYNKNAVMIGSFLGGPLAVGYVMAKNFNSLGEQNGNRILWSWLAMIVGILIALSLMLVHVLILLIIFCVFTYYGFQSLQGAQLQNHIINGGLVFSEWKALAISLISAAIYFFAFVVVLVIEKFLIISEVAR